MFEKKLEPICAYDLERMLISKSYTHLNGRELVNVRCKKCPNNSVLPVNHLVCPVCFSDLILGAGMWICSNPACSSYVVEETTIFSEKVFVVSCHQVFREELFSFRLDGSYLKCGDVWLAPSIICSLIIQVVERHIAEHGLNLKVAKIQSYHERN